MKASFVITFHTARLDNLLQTLRFLARFHPEVVNQSHLVTVCQDTCEFQNPETLKTLADLRGQFKASNHFDMELDNMMLPRVTNFGVNMCDSNKVIILESDRILPPGYFASVIDQLKPKVSFTCRQMKKLYSPVADEDIIAGNFDYKDESRSESNQIGARNMWSGNTAIWKDDFLEAGGMDEGYVGYGWADSDMTYTMEHYGVQSVFRDEIELHLWHPAATYGTSDQKKLFIDNGVRFCRKWNETYPDWFRDEISRHKRVMM